MEQAGNVDRSADDAGGDGGGSSSTKDTLRPLVSASVEDCNSVSSRSSATASSAVVDTAPSAAESKPGGGIPTPVEACGCTWLVTEPPVALRFLRPPTTSDLRSDDDEGSRDFGLGGGASRGGEDGGMIAGVGSGCCKRRGVRTALRLCCS